MEKAFHALILEGSLNASLAVVRSLGKMGAIITVGDHHRISPALLSRYVTKRIRYPNPEEDLNLFLQFLSDHLKQKRYDLIFPMSDFTVLPIARNLDRFKGHAKFALAPLEQIEKVQDKVLTIAIARSCGVLFPHTVIPDSIDEIERVANNIEYPVIVKPRSKVSWVGSRPCVNKVTARNFVSSPDELVTIYRDIHNTSPLPMIQEIIDGAGYGFFALMVQGEPKAVFGHRRIREYPISGGTSSCRESYLDSELENSGLKILKALKWDGVAMVEFKLDRKDNRYKLMEINGRWWGSLPLALAAGADFPSLYSRYLLGDNIDNTSFSFQKGIRCRALLPFDLLWLMERLRRPGRLSALREFFRPDGFRFDVLSLSDPLPTLGSCALMLSYFRDVLAGNLTMTGEKRS